MSEVRTITDESLAQAVEIIRDGGLIVIPTDTVYALGASIDSEDAIRRIYEAKNRIYILKNRSRTHSRCKSFVN